MCLYKWLSSLLSSFILYIQYNNGNWIDMYLFTLHFKERGTSFNIESIERFNIFVCVDFVCVFVCVSVIFSTNKLIYIFFVAFKHPYGISSNESRIHDWNFHQLSKFDMFVCICLFVCLWNLILTVYILFCLFFLLIRNLKLAFLLN